MKLKSFLITILVLTSCPTGAQPSDQDYLVDLNLSNDMFFFTDHYFSSGIQFRFYAPFFSKSPFSKILLPQNKRNTTYYGISITHNIYTPVYIDTVSRRETDYPFAAYLLLGIRKESFNPARKLKTTSEMQLGVIGPLAGGQVFQNTLHEYINFAGPVPGWEQQISNNFCVQYSASLEKGFVSFSHFEMNARIRGRIGLPHTDAQLGLIARIGLFDPYFRHIGVSRNSMWQCWLFVAQHINLVGYDATLQGGYHNSGISKPLQSINHTVLQTRFGGTVAFRTIRLEIAQEVVSPPFQSGLWHRWTNASLLLLF